jgi:hypothetical protein
MLPREEFPELFESRLLTISSMLFRISSFGFRLVIHSSIEGPRDFNVQISLNASHENWGLTETFISMGVLEILRNPLCLSMASFAMSKSAEYHVIRFNPSLSGVLRM